MTRATRLAGFAAAALVAAACAPRPARLLRVCADPNNLPFSNHNQAGFENRVAALIAEDLGARLEYTWWAQRRGFVRNTLNAGACDVVMGVPAGFESLQTTAPYYESTYVFAARHDRGLHIQSLDDPRLRDLRIGVQMIGDDAANTPPAHALSRRGLVRNVVGFSVLGDYAQPHPLSGIMEAVDRGDVDAAVVWGPVAGYFARQATHAMELTPVSPRADGPFPFTFAIAMGVRRGDAALRAELDRALARRAPDIDRVLDDFGVPRAEATR